jgi:membrane fusion protein, multidrug efflux system
MKLPGPLASAGIIIVLVGGYFALGTITKAPPSVEEKTEDPLFRVVITGHQPTTEAALIPVNGRMSAERAVSVLAKTSASVAAIKVREGDAVSAGTALCVLEKDARGAILAEARAAFAKARLDRDAAKQLTAQGFQSEAGLAGAEAFYDQAKAALERAELDFNNTVIRAPFDGVVTTVLLDKGDLAQPGVPCAVVADLDPIIFEADLSEHEISAISKDAEAQIILSDGSKIEGKVRYAAAAVNPGTRSYRVEITAPNPRGEIRDGLTAKALIQSSNQQTYTIPRSAILINDQGIEGIRIVERKNSTDQQKLGMVKFIPIEIISDNADGIKIIGPSGDIEIITRGKDYVIAGQTVEIAAPGDSWF